MKKPKGPKRIVANFPAPKQPIPAPGPQKALPKVADFALNFTTEDKIISISVSVDQMEKFAGMFTALLKQAGIVYSKEEKLR